MDFDKISWVWGFTGLVEELKCLHLCVSPSEEQLLLVLCSGGQKGWHVFYHFVGAVPGSTELLGLLCRLLYEMKALPVNTSNDDDDDDDSHAVLSM